MKFDALDRFLIACAATIVFMLGCCCGASCIRNQAINRGYAEYNATTGEWQWKGEDPEAKE